MGALEPLPSDIRRSLTAPEQPCAETLRVPVLKVFDGDGFLTRINTHRGEVEATIRFGFVDAPEIGQRGGNSAREFLKSLISDKWLDIVVLTKMDTGQIVDRYGRIVGIPYLTQKLLYPDRPKPFLQRLADWDFSAATVTRNIELEMVLNGWAWVLERYGPDEQYYRALEDARRHKRGIWAFDDNIHPWDFKKAKHRKRVGRSRPKTEPDLFTSSDLGRCPASQCEGQLVRRNGKFGPFLGCSNFPRCKHTQSTGSGAV